MPSMPCYRMPLFREKEKMQTEKIRINEVLEKEYKLTSWDHDIFHKVMEHWDGIAKPLDGMGQFEPMLAKIGAIQKTLEPRFDVGCLLVFCADNGVVAEGISQSPQEVTATCAKNIAAGQTAVGRMASLAGCQIRVYDVGINTRETLCNVIDEKVAHGTRDFYKESAMDETQMRQALQCGLDAVYACKCDNLDYVCIGEMGIGNTTTSSAVAAALLQKKAEEVTGRGAGLDDVKLQKKIRVIQETIERCDLYQASATEVLAKVGGFDIAAMAGACMGAAIYEIPLILDGLISMVAALAAERLLPGSKDFLIASHASREPATIALIKELALAPVIYADMALGEGTGAMMLLPMLAMAKAVYDETNSFSDAGVETYHRYGDKI